MAREPNPRVDPESPAAKIAARFDPNGLPRANALAKALGRSPSTIQRWLTKGSIPSEDHAAVVEAGRGHKVTVEKEVDRPVILKPADFVDERAFAETGKKKRAKVQPQAEARA